MVYQRNEQDKVFDTELWKRMFKYKDNPKAKLDNLVKICDEEIMECIYLLREISTRMDNLERKVDELATK